MKSVVCLWQLMGFAITSLSGTVLHFLYEWLGEPLWIAPFSGVNESTWEHMKLLFWPMLLFALFESIFFRERVDFWCVKLRGILLGISLIPIIFYTYNGVIGHSPDWINIAIFFIAAGISYIYEAIKLNTDTPVCKGKGFSIFVLCIVAALFVIFTFNTPGIEIFKDPLTSSYGI